MTQRRSSQLSFDYAAKGAPVCREVASPHCRKVRLGLIASVVSLWVFGLFYRLLDLQVWDYDTWQDWALKQHFSEIELASRRGAIVDRNNKLMAVSVPASSIYVRPKEIKDPKRTAQLLAQVLSISPKELQAKLQANKKFTWVQRQVPRKLAEKVDQLNLAGVGHVLESKRFYPYERAASTLIGKVGIDGNGLSGLESLYDKILRGERVTAKVNRDALGNIIDLDHSDLDSFELPEGSSLQLTLDAELQMIIDEELEIGRKNANAKGAYAVLVDAETGEVLGMSQAPGLNLNETEIKDSKQLRNLIMESVYEPGSTLKPIVAAAALELGVVKPSEMIDCEHGNLRVGKHIIKDVHPNDLISFRDVVVRSSNIGMTKVGLRLGKEKLYSFLRKFGFGDSSKLNLRGETSGILRPVESWSGIDVATHSFGQGLAVTPLQMVRAMSAIANGGRLPEISLVVKDSPLKLKRIISEETSSKVREMMYAVLDDEHGTGKLAIIPGVRAAGKTGTAQKARADGRGYQQGAYVASFVGFVDGSELGLKRTLTLIVAIDEPNAKTIYGGTLAAPVFKAIMHRVLQVLMTRSDLKPAPEAVDPEPFDSGPTWDGNVTLTKAAYSL